MIDHASRSHKRFAASAASRWMACPGSIRLCESIPEPPPTSYALEGTLAHEWLEYRLAGKARPKEEATPEMLEAVEEARKFVLSEMRVNQRVFEHQVALKCSEDVGGTLDVAGWDSFIRVLWVVDFKYGSGVTVEADDNKQMQIYAQGAIDTFGWEPLKIAMVIIQPRAYHPAGVTRMALISRSELFDFEADVAEAVARCLEPDAPLIPGDEQCRWCPAKAICPALEKKALMVVNESFKDVRQIKPAVLPDPVEMTPDRIGQILAAKDLIQDWFKSVEEEAYKQAMSGVKIPGRKLVAPAGKRTWDIPNQDSIAVAKKLVTITVDTAEKGIRSPKGMYEFLEQKLIGVTEAEKILKPYGKKALEAMNELCPKKSNGKLQLVSERDARPAVQPASVAFGNVVQLPPTVETGDTE